jgi:hypothetical protein
MNKKNYLDQEEDDFNGLSRRHVAQITRRKMLTKVKPSGKKASRNGTKKWTDEE